MRLQELYGKRIAVWGLGREGQSIIERLQREFPSQTILLLDEKKPTAELLKKFSHSGTIEFHFTHTNLVQLLSSVDVVIRSPGISRYRPEIAEALAKGTIFTTATNLWFGEIQTDRSIVITGTKGKSTTSALLAYLLEASGFSVALGGNIGTSLISLLNYKQSVDIWVVELSSYQISDLDNWPEIGILLNLYPEHFQWHGSFEKYYQDKLNLFADRKRCQPILNYTDPLTQYYTSNWDKIIYFNTPNAIHVQKTHILDNSQPLISASDIALKGIHNLSNICAALTALRFLRIDIQKVLPAIAKFNGLPHRLQILGERQGITFIDDSISTIPESAIAAVNTFKEKPITILLGGMERHQDYKILAQNLCEQSIYAVITMHETGARIAQEFYALQQKHLPLVIEQVDLEQAVKVALRITPKGGIILLSPAAPSYDAYINYQERGHLFRQLVGFD